MKYRESSRSGKYEEVNVGEIVMAFYSRLVNPGVRDDRSLLGFGPSELFVVPVYNYPFLHFLFHRNMGDR
jgi:hypothetical protein